MSWQCDKRLSMRGSKKDIDALTAKPNLFATFFPAPRGLKGDELVKWKEDNWAGFDPDKKMKINRIKPGYAEYVGETWESEAFPLMMIESISAQFPKVQFFWEWCSWDGGGVSGCALLTEGILREVLETRSDLSRLAWDRQNIASVVAGFWTPENHDGTNKKGSSRTETYHGWDYTLVE